MATLIQRIFEQQYFIIYYSRSPVIEFIPSYQCGSTFKAEI